MQGTPYVPGRAHGILRRDPALAGAETLVLLSARRLPSLAARPAGLLVVGGAPLSHAMIRLFGLGVPVVLLDEAQASQLTDGTPLVIDGGDGRVEEGERLPGERQGVPTPPRPGEAVTTADGQAVFLRASVAHAEAAAAAVASGAEAIGAVRSEFLVPASGLPDADFFYRAFDAICTAAHPLAVTVRLLDIAPDKHPPWLADLPGLRSPLGLRGPRLYDVEPVRRVFEAQLEALGRLGAERELRLLLPYLARPEEYRRWRRRIEDLLPVPLAVGAMAETPAGVLEMADWIMEADFVAIGCNDLMQGLFGVDRRVPEVVGLLDPYAPVLFRFLRQVAEMADAEVADIQLDGLLPQAPGILPPLLGLGYRTFSMEPPLIPYYARLVAATDTRSAEGLAAALCAASDAESVRSLLGLRAVAPWAIGSIAAAH